MSAIANQWTGNGLADGVTLNAGNINTAGNGSTVTYNGSGTGEMVTAGDGFCVVSGDNATIRRIDCAVSGQSIRTQFKLKVDSFPSAETIVLQPRTAAAAVRVISLKADGRIGLSGESDATFAPVISLGDTVLVDAVFAQSPSPTTSNGRAFYRVKNLTNPTWNTSGEYFWDSGYTTTIGTTDLAQVRFGKIGSGAFSAPGIRWEFPGWEAITVNTSHTSESQAKAYFADTPVPSVPAPATPVPTVSSITPPTTVGGTDGSAVVSWPAVPGATRYEVGVAVGYDQTTGFTVRSTNATSPYTLTNLGPGPRTAAVRAVAE